MATAIILSGGTGSRMNLDALPKQYVIVGDRALITYATKPFDESERIDAIVVVADEAWRPEIERWFAQAGIAKPVLFADPGTSRQGSIASGLQKASEHPPADDAVIVHDAARPNVTPQMIDEYLAALEGHDAVLPVLPMHDTVYYSETGEAIDSLLEREKVFAGQAPECFRFQKYLTVNAEASPEEIYATRGSSEIAYKHDMIVRLVKGSDANYKITTQTDLERFCESMGVDFQSCLSGIG